MNTQSVKYAGSKLKLLPQIIDLIPNDVTSMLDGFSGSTRVSQALAQSGYTVASNDTSELSYVLAQTYLNTSDDDYQEIINHLNNLKPVEGWFTDNYGGISDTKSSIQSDGLKRIWQRHNTMKLDAVRAEIDALDDSLKYIALTSLILAMDAVDSSLGHHVSYLKEWSSRSYKNAILKVPAIIHNEKKHQIIKGDIFDVVNTHYDCVYLDPPYGSSNDKMPSSRVRYDSYYHLWKTVILNDKPELFGKARRRQDSRDNFNCPFEDYRDRFAYNAMNRLITSITCNYVIISYNNNGIITLKDIIDILNNNGKILETVVIDYKRNVMASMSWTREWLNQNNTNQEFLFLLDKRG